MDPDKLQEMLDGVTAQCDSLAQAKNHDYGAAWMSMRPTSITDQILVKVKRMKQLEDMATRGESPRVAEGISSELRDIVNYARFELAMLSWSSPSPLDRSSP